MDLSIIIVNWNSSAYLEKCLASVFENTHGIEFEVIVVDNASFDGCGEMLARRFPGVTFIQSQENLGFAGANNLGFEHSTGGALLFLNPDTEVIGDAIPTLFQALRSLPDAGAVGAKLLNSDGSVQTSCIQRFPTIWNQAIDTDILRRTFPTLRAWGMEPLLASQPGPVAVDMISGACLVARRAAFERVGRFTPDYFMYAEDLDLCYKLHQTGARNYYVDRAVVVHHGGGSTEHCQTGFAAVRTRHARMQFFALRRGRLHAAAYRASVVLLAAFRIVLSAASMASSRRRRRMRNAIHRWTAVLQWAMGLSPVRPRSAARPTAPIRMEGRDIQCVASADK